MLSVPCIECSFSKKLNLHHKYLTVYKFIAFINQLSSDHALLVLCFNCTRKTDEYNIRGQ